ncbi:MAG: hypothetical protein AAFQ20_03470 [Bacteroidota bacterium]
MALIVIKIVPKKPQTAAAFKEALDGLEVKAFDFSFNNPQGAEIGSARYIAPDVGTNPNPGPNPVPIPDTDTRIVQHFTISGIAPNKIRKDFAIATALIEVPAGPEYKSPDLRLEITRSGGQINHESFYFNVPVAPNAMPGNRNNFQSDNIKPISIYLPIPPKGQQLDPNDAYVETEADGTPPNYQDVLDAINIVVADDPRGLIDLKTLTEEQSEHIANEIAWNETIHPTPQSSNNELEEYYTTGHGNDQDDEGNRRRFEGELHSHYAQRIAEGKRLTKFVFAVSAALWAEEQSTQAKSVLFRMPVVPDSTPPPELSNHTTLVLDDPGGNPLNPPFEVEARFFYALAAELPPLVDKEKRYNMAIRELSENLLEKFDEALVKNIIAPPGPGQLTRFQATRRLTTLFVKEDSKAPRCIPINEASATIQGWLDFQNEDIQTYWSGLNAAQELGHLQLLLCALGKDHQTFTDGILAEGIISATELEAWKEQKWREVISASPDMIPPFIYQGAQQQL